MCPEMQLTLGEFIKLKVEHLYLIIQNLNIGNYLEEPKLLTKIVRNKNYLYDLKYSVSGSIVFDDGSISIYYKINNQWYRDSFDKTGVFTSKQNIISV